MRSAIALVLVVACHSTTVEYPRKLRLGERQLYVVVDEKIRLANGASYSGDPGVRERLGVVEIDLATVTCRWRRSAMMRDAPSGFTEVGAWDELSFERDELVHVNGTRVKLDGTPKRWRDLILVPDPAGAWLVLDRHLRVLDTITFPLGELAAIAPGAATFASPLGAITFTGDRNEAPVAGVRPPSALDAWWNRKRVLRVGDTTRTPRGTQVRRTRKLVELDRDGVKSRYPATQVTYFDDTELVSTGTMLLDVATGKELHAFVDAVLVFAGGTYLRLADGTVWYATGDISAAKPLHVELSLVAFRGDSLVFSTLETAAVYLYDLRTRRWRWTGYRDCLPEKAR